MAFGIIVFCVITALFCLIKTKEWLNPGTVFLAYWGFVVFMASLRLYDLMETSERTYIMIFVGLIAYFVGSVFGTTLKFKIGTEHSSEKKYMEINYHFLLMAEIIIIIYSLYRLSMIAQLLISGNSWWEIRLMATSGGSGMGTIKGGNFSQVIYECVVAPLAYLVAPTISADLIVGNRKKQTLILGIISMLVFSISTVSRAIWAFTIIYVIAIVVLHRKKYKLTKTQKRIMKFVPIIIVILALVINQITKMRNSEADILQNAYTYISGALPLLSIHLESPLAETRTYGMLSLFGFLYPILFLLNLLRIIPYTRTYYDVQMIKDNLEVFRNIGNGINMNAYSTLFYDFYIDFGMIGVLIGSFLFGYICMRVFCNYKQTLSKRSLVLYLILLQFIIFSMARIYTIYATRALSIFWIIFMFKQVEKNEHRIEF